MKKTSAFQEAKPRTPKGEARKREQKIMDAMADLVERKRLTNTPVRGEVSVFKWPDEQRTKVVGTQAAHPR